MKFCLLLVACCCFALLSSTIAQEEVEYEEQPLLKSDEEQSVNEDMKAIEILDLKKALSFADSDFNDIMSIIDGDNDGVIEKHEMMLLFTMLDDNRDKSLTKRETSSWISTMNSAGKFVPLFTQNICNVMAHILHVLHDEY